MELWNPYFDPPQTEPVRTIGVWVIWALDDARRLISNQVAARRVVHLDLHSKPPVLNLIVRVHSHHNQTVSSEKVSAALRAAVRSNFTSAVDDVESIFGTHCAFLHEKYLQGHVYSR